MYPAYYSKFRGYYDPAAEFTVEKLTTAGKFVAEKTKPARDYLNEKVPIVIEKVIACVAAGLVYLPILIYLYLPVCMSFCLPICVCVCLSVCLRACLSVSVVWSLFSVCLSVCLFACRCV